MKKSKAAKLDYYEVVVEDRDLFMAMDTLLRRVLGKDAAMITVPKKSNPNKRWKFHFWATRPEFDLIHGKMDELMSQKLDEEYEKLINEVVL